jgi:hypothetical protein
MDHHLREIADCLDEVLASVPGNGAHRTGLRGSWDEPWRPYPSRESDRALFRRPSVSGGAQSPSQRHGLTGRRSSPLGSGV